MAADNIIKHNFIFMGYISTKFSWPNTNFNGQKTGASFLVRILLWCRKIAMVSILLWCRSRGPAALAVPNSTETKLSKTKDKQNQQGGAGSGSCKRCGKRHKPRSTCSYTDVTGKVMIIFNHNTCPKQLEKPQLKIPS